MSSILIIYTGGTIGSFEDHATKSLKPVNFEQLKEYIPELNRIDAAISVHAFPQPKDSSDMQPADWVTIVETIRDNYEKYDGFVVLHGTDTMAFTASAVGFMIENLSKPVIFTGSQLPIGKIRTDGKENLITAVEIAATQKNGKPVVPEVCIYFEFKLYRANRTFKFSSEHFNAYLSPNYPFLAEAGVTIEYNTNAIRPMPEGEVKFHTQLDTAIGIVSLFPGIQKEMLECIFRVPHTRAIILETFGFGNGPIQEWLFGLLREAIADGKIILNITQCKQGGVIQGRYETSREFERIGVTGGADMTRETAITKLMHLLAYHTDAEMIRRQLQIPLRGELTV
jgi:L-asparaginase